MTRLARIAALVALLPRLAVAAISCTTGTPAVLNATTNATTYAFASFTPTTNATLVVIALIRTTVDAGSMSNTSGTALTWHQKTKGTFNAGADTIYVYWANTPSSTAASVYTINVAGDAGAGVYAALYTCTGSDIVTADPLRQAVINTGTSTNATSGTITALGTNNGYASCWNGALTSATNSTAPASWTEDSDGIYATPSTNGSCASRSTGDTSTTVTFTNLTTTWGLALVEVYAAGAGPPSTWRSLSGVGP